MSKLPNRLCVRAVDFTPVGEEERAKDESGDGKTLTGYAAVFNQATEIKSWEGNFSETIARGAFRKTIAERMPVLQFDHGHDARTGSVPIGKFEELTEDRKGLRVSARLFENPVVEPIRQAIEGGAISGMSFRFEVTRDEWRDKEGKRIKPTELGELLWQPGERGPLARTIREVKLFEAGPVVFPAYPQTSVGVRALTEEERESLVEQYQRTAVEDDERGMSLASDDEPEQPEEASEREDGDLESEVEAERKDPKKPYGDVTYADPGYQKDGKKRYPLDTVDHCKAAWSYINMPKNAKKYSSGDLAKVKAKIKAALKKFGVDIDEGKSGDDAFTETSTSEPVRTDGSPEDETPETPPVFEGTSPGLRSARLREIRLAELNNQSQKGN